MRDQPAGWYRDTERPNLHRYWSGERWSDWLGEELSGRFADARRGHEKQRDARYDEARACG